MAATLVVAYDGAYFVVGPEGTARRFALTVDSTGGGSGTRGPLPSVLLAALRERPPAELRAGGDALGRLLEQGLGRPVPRARVPEWHAALSRLPRPSPGAERTRLLAEARTALDLALRAPSEVLVSLAREEERLERAVGREQRAAEAFVAVEGTSLAAHAAAWERARGLLERHHAELIHRLEQEARTTAPNLSAVVGARTAARLVAAAGGLAQLARISSSRLQLLGARRRPHPTHGPRFGAICLAEGSDRVPADRQGAYARSLAGLAAIAARADSSSHRDISAELVKRRERRVTQLSRRAR